MAVEGAALSTSILVCNDMHAYRLRVLQLGFGLCCPISAFCFSTLFSIHMLVILNTELDLIVFFLVLAGRLLGMKTFESFAVL